MFFFRFLDAVILLKDRIVHMPTPQQMANNAAVVKQKYGLSNVVCGIDSTHCGFDGKPQ